MPPGMIAMHDRRVLIGTGTTALELRRVQPSGRTAMAAADWWRGAAREQAVAR
jgi:methionyl-tRNA formyltransferase